MIGYWKYGESWKKKNRSNFKWGNGVDDPGKAGWTDITVDDIEGLRDFHMNVSGSKPEAFDTGDYVGFIMTMPGSGTPVAGTCHARDVSAGLPGQSLIHKVVADAEPLVPKMAASFSSVRMT